MILPVSATRAGARLIRFRRDGSDVASRLRAAGQTVVPSDTVVALEAARRRSRPGPTSTTSPAPPLANIVMRATPSRTQLPARGVLETVHGREYALAAHGDGDTVIDAARIAADRMAILLGFGVVEPDAGIGAERPARLRCSR